MADGVVSKNQIDFFNSLTEEKQFPEGTDIAKLRKDFANLPNSKSASAWIEKAMGLPRVSGGGGELVEAPF